eukprot:765854-Hanusia_phi.AAC.1
MIRTSEVPFGRPFLPEDGPTQQAFTQYCSDLSAPGPGLVTLMMMITGSSPGIDLTRRDVHGRMPGWHNCP